MARGPRRLAALRPTASGQADRAPLTCDRVARGGRRRPPGPLPLSLRAHASVLSAAATPGLPARRDPARPHPTHVLPAQGPAGAPAGVLSLEPATGRFSRRAHYGVRAVAHGDPVAAASAAASGEDDPQRRRLRAQRDGERARAPADRAPVHPLRRLIRTSQESRAGAACVPPPGRGRVSAPVGGGGRTSLGP